MTPGNPLKSLTGLAALNARMEAARRLDVGPRVVVSDIEAQINSRYTYETLRVDQTPRAGRPFRLDHGRRQPRQFHLWRHWRVDRRPHADRRRRPARLDPEGGLERSRRGALPRFRVPERDAARFATMPPPALIFLHGPRSGLSSTALRDERSSPDLVPQTARQASVSKDDRQKAAPFA